MSEVTTTTGFDGKGSPGALCSALAVSAMAFSPAGYAMPGTGGSTDAHYLINKGTWVHDEAIEYCAPAEATGSARDAVPDPPRILARLRDSLGLSVTDLAKAFEVSRPTIYAWMKGETEPRPELWPRLEEMAQLASRAEYYSLPRASRLVRRPLLDGSSLLERPQAGQEIQEGHLQRLADVARNEESQRARTKGGAAQPVDEVVRQHGRPTG